MKTIEKLKQPRWYKGEKFEYELNLSNKGKVVAFFRMEAGRYGGRRKYYVYYKVFENGVMVWVNLTMMKTGVSQGITTPFQLRNSTKREFDTAMKKYLKLIG
jgi:hypothetical protein